MFLATTNKTRRLLHLSYIDHVTLAELERGYPEVVALLAHELALHDRPVPITVVEPHVTELPKALARAGNVTFGTIEQGLQADLLVMLVDHRAFGLVPPERLEVKTIIDTRGLWHGAPVRS